MVQRITLILLLSACIPLKAQIIFDTLRSDNKTVYFNGIAPGDWTIHLSPEAVPIAGSWTFGDADAIFRPVFPLIEVHTYTLKENGNVAGQLRLPVREKPAPSVAVIHPRTDTLPANLLKFYIVFDQPMATGHAGEYIQLYNLQTKQEEANAFLHLEQELWSYTGDTLTMWLDPGRIKRDLIPNREMGNPLEEGSSYSLRIRSGWPAQNGTPLSENYNRDFVVGKLDREIPDLTTWKLTVPTSGTKQPLTIHLAEAMDMGALLEAIKICKDDKLPVSVRLALGPTDREVRLYPHKAWESGEYVVKVAEWTEDLAGNRMDRLFDQTRSADTNSSFQSKLYFVLE